MINQVLSKQSTLSYSAYYEYFRRTRKVSIPVEIIEKILPLLEPKHAAIKDELMKYISHRERDYAEIDTKIQSLQKLSNSDIFWDRIKQITIIYFQITLVP